MYTKYLYLIIILKIFLIENQFTSASTRRYHVDFHNYTCQKFGSQLLQFDCKYQKLSKHHFAFFHSLIFDREMNDNFKVRIWIDFKQQKAKKYLHLIDIKMEACKALEENFDNQLIKFLTNEYIRVTNLPQKCPFQKNFLYKMENFSITTRNYPAYAPQCSFIFALDYYDFNSLFGRHKIMGSIINN